MLWHSLYLVLLLNAAGISVVHSWEEAELELFDVVEDVDQNFYELMGISKDAALPEIKKAYRTLSKQLHPDKNDAPDADVMFRQLVSVYEVLKDPKLREMYEKVLVDGLPDWRSPIYYYRRARKMSLVEITIILLLVISITQYLMAWGSYVDKRQTLEEFLCRKYKIKDKRKKTAEDLENLRLMDEELTLLPKPSCWNILPVQLVKLSIFLVKDGPGLVHSLIISIKEEKRLREEELLLQQENEKLMIEEEEKRKENRAIMKVRKREKVYKLPEYTGEERESNRNKARARDSANVVEESMPAITGGPWSALDFAELAKLMGKYPGGTVDRWEKIAATMNRTTYEVTTMSSRVKQMPMVRPIVEEEAAQYLQRIKIKTRKIEQALPGPTERDDAGVDTNTSTTASPVEEIAVEDESEGSWSALQQKVLETSLKTFPKGTDQRWEIIARCVPGKNKEECMVRYKSLADKIRKKKEVS